MLQEAMSEILNLMENEFTEPLENEFLLECWPLLKVMNFEQKYI
jgi:hypothetical protein